jgi:peptidyl-prolyl cis-trans isomerase SurA
MNGDEISDLMNQEKKQITITKGNWEKGANPIVDYYVWNSPEPQYFVAEHTFIRGDMIKPGPKNLEEARGHYISDYQNFLEEKWIKQLRKKYKIKINKKLLKTIQGV